MIIRVKVSRAENLSYFGCVAGDIVNIDMEEYVAGVVASEIGNSHIEACKAQAIAARTFAMNYVGDDKYITDQSSTHQAFRASRWDASQYPNANEAAALTAGMVLTYDGKLLKTCSYSSSNGGRTTSSEERWGGYRPYLIAQDDPWDAAACAERTAVGKSITKGHGVGMSQYGAAWAANHGIGYREILGFYYVGAKVATNYGKDDESEMAENTNTTEMTPQSPLANAMLEDSRLQAEAAKRKEIPFTNDHFVEFLRAMLGRPYWYGTCIYKCSNSLLSRKTDQYPSHYGSGRTATYKKHIAAKEVCADCIGAAKGYAWTNAGEGVVEAIGNDNSITSKYGSNKCPDKGANSMFAHAKDKGMSWGTIGTIPEIVGLAVTFSGHVGYYIGNGKVIEFKGFNYGCVETNLSAGKWTHWYMLPFLDYGTDTDANTPAQGGTVEPVKYTLGSRLLKRGSKGDDVAHLQSILAGMGYDLGTYGEKNDGVDGDYGEKTEKAVKRFQSFAQIEVDGKYGSITHKALMGVLDDITKGENDGADDDDTPVTPAGKHVLATSNSVNVRSGPATTYKVLTRVNKGDTMPYIATAEALGWHAVEINGKIGWISGKYSEVKEG